MKNSITILSVFLMVSIGFTGVAQKSKRINFKESLSAKKTHPLNDGKTEFQKDAMLTKALISKPGNSEDYFWNETEWGYTYDTEYSYNNDGLPTEELTTLANSGENQSRKTWIWDDHDNRTDYINYYWNGTEWEISGGYKYIYTYDANKNITERVYQDWQAGDWVNSGRHIYEYNNNGFETSFTYQKWGNDAWVNDWKDEYTVGNQGEWSEMTNYFWESEAWVYERRYIDIVWYNWDQVQVQSYLYQIWEGEWIDYGRYNATYTGNNYIAIYEAYENNSWVNDGRETYTQSLTEQIRLSEDFENNGWVNSSRISTFYDDHENYAGDRSEYWENEEWVIQWETSYLYTYNENNEITEEVLMYLNPETHELENSSRYVYSNFQYFQSRLNDIISLDDVKVFPNPVEDILNIDTQNKNLLEPIVQILNITGQKVYEGTLSGQLTSIDVNSLTKGVYILHIQTKDNSILNYKILKH